MEMRRAVTRVYDQLKQHGQRRCSVVIVVLGPNNSATRLDDAVETLTQARRVRCNSKEADFLQHSLASGYYYDICHEIFPMVLSHDEQCLH